jgi:hypothetical protein
MTATTATEPQLTGQFHPERLAAQVVPFPGAYNMARQALALREAGKATAALELQLQLAWADRCIHCGHPLRRGDSRDAGAGRLCARIHR